MIEMFDLSFAASCINHIDNKADFVTSEKVSVGPSFYSPDTHNPAGKGQLHR